MTNDEFRELPEVKALHDRVKACVKKIGGLTALFTCADDDYDATKENLDEASQLHGAFYGHTDINKVKALEPRIKKLEDKI